MSTVARHVALMVQAAAALKRVRELLTRHLEREEGGESPDEPEPPAPSPPSDSYDR